MRYALQLMETARLELQPGRDNTNGEAVTRLNGKLSLETVNSFIQTLRKEPATHLGAGHERRFVPRFIGSRCAGFVICHA
jgi:hypothetical protein